MAGLLALVFNPSAWIAIGISAMVGFSSGVMLEHQLVNARAWRDQVAALKRAAADSQKIAGEDNRRAAANAKEAERLQNELDKLVAETKAGACRLSELELRSLRKLTR